MALVVALQMREIAPVEGHGWRIIDPGELCSPAQPEGGWAYAMPPEQKSPALSRG